MRLTCPLLVAALTVVALGCSEGAGTAESVATPAVPQAAAYPADAAEVTADSRYTLEYRGSESGIAYYVRSISAEEAAAFPEDYVVESESESESTSYVFVPIKDGAIVDAPLADRIGLGYAMSARESAGPN